MANDLYNLGALYSKMKRSDEAYRHFERSIVIYEQKAGVSHPGLVVSLLSLANCLLYTSPSPRD